MASSIIDTANQMTIVLAIMLAVLFWKKVLVFILFVLSYCLSYWMLENVFGWKGNSKGGTTVELLPLLFSVIPLTVLCFVLSPVIGKYFLQEKRSR